MITVFTVVPPMSVLTETQQALPGPQGEGETQMSKCKST